MKEIYRIFDLQFFANPNTNVTTDTAATTGNELSYEMKTYYNTELLENVRANMVFNQFGKTQPLPGGKGKKVEWRKFEEYGKALTPLTEGVTPDGHKMDVSHVEAEVSQYGDYTTVSDVLDLTAIDDVILACTDEHSAQAAATLDTLTRDVLVAGTNVIYAPKVSGSTVTPVSARADLDNTALLTPSVVNRAVTELKKKNTPKINGKYIAIIHPSVAEDLRECDGWLEAHKYASPEQIYNGEIGELHGVRFIETTEAKISVPRVISGGKNKLTVKTAITSETVNKKEIVVKEEIDSFDYSSDSTEDRWVPVYIDSQPHLVKKVVKGTNESTLTVKDNIDPVAADKLIFGAGGTKDGKAVYLNIFLGKDAYGTVDLEGAGLEMIVKALGSGGSADPLNQRQTVGWKASHAATILYPFRVLRVETGSSYMATDTAN